MSDFLQNLRNQSAAKERRFNKTTKSYESGAAHHHPERRSGQDRRTRATRPAGIKEENLSGLKEAVEALIHTERERLLVEERRVDAEERKAAAMEQMAGQFEAFLAQLAEGGSTRPLLSPEMRTMEEADPDDVRKTSRSYILKLIAQMRKEGATYDQIAAYLTDNKFPTFSSRGRWHAQTIHRLCQ